MAFTIETSGSYTNPTRANIHVNFADGSYVGAQTVSASLAAYMFKIPADCVVVRGHWSGSLPSGVSGQAVIKLGTEITDNLFGTVTVSGGAATPKSMLFGPFTGSGSASLGYHSVVATVNSGPSATTSLSLYLLLEYVMPGNLGS